MYTLLTSYILTHNWTYWKNIYTVKVAWYAWILLLTKEFIRLQPRYIEIEIEISLLTKSGPQEGIYK
jgi:hypothetical protein